MHVCYFILISGAVDLYFITGFIIQRVIKKRSQREGARPLIFALNS